ncbi:FAD-dependent oxidoreductase [Streptomyces sp. AP-93]|uniref:FAD-dependent oxidoreductase n=1 Tax=Streptomyces sp. AP-93 TaxID=2929048 RepID=UPI0035ADF1BF
MGTHPAGQSVVVLEANRVAAGVTGHTTGKLTALHTAVYDPLRTKHGDDAAGRYAASQSTALRHVIEVADTLGIDCELERRPAVTYSERPEAVEALRAEAEAARSAGLSASFVTETGLPFPVAGAVRVEDQAQFHPLKYLRGLVEDIAARGGRAFRIRGSGVQSPAPTPTLTSRTASRAAPTRHRAIATVHAPADHIRARTVAWPPASS